MTRFSGKSVLITGAARGIGFEFAKAFAAEGARVAIVDINASAALKAAQTIGNGAIAVACDIADKASIDNAVNTVETELGGIDILVNNAALFSAAPIIEITEADYQKLFSINVFGTMFMTQAVAKVMIANGKGGKIINMASQAGRRGEALVGVYCATKAAVIRFRPNLRV